MTILLFAKIEISRKVAGLLREKISLATTVFKVSRKFASRFIDKLGMIILKIREKLFMKREMISRNLEFSRKIC